jgi:hypothetical protein
MKYLLIISLLFLAGCTFFKYVDEKGRDCEHNVIFPFAWETCDTTQEPLATTRQEIKVDATINQTK